METMQREYRTMDKVTWGAGIWQSEPDKVQWVDETTGLDCLAVRNSMGAWCGYVGVTDAHPWFSKGYSECVIGCDERWCSHSPESRIDVHGGITFSDACDERPSAEATGICHVAFTGRPERVWWFGFDCAHGGDYIPNMPRYFAPERADVYRDLPYVREQCAHMAAQLVTAVPMTTPPTGAREG